MLHTGPRATGLPGGQAGPGVLVYEQGQRPGSDVAGDRIELAGVAGGDDHAATGVQVVGEVVAQAPVLTRGHAGGAALADPARVDGSPGRVDRVTVHPGRAHSEEVGRHHRDVAVARG